MAGTYNFNIKQNTDFSRSITWKDSNGDAVDLTGKSARLVAKVRYSDTTPVIDVDTANNITLGADGLITISFSETETRAMTFRFARFDLFIDDTPLLEGEITIQRSTISD